jgi:replicative DNA helicase
MLARAEERIFGILDSKGEARARSIHDILFETLKRIDDRQSQTHRCLGLETGFYDFDELVGGLHKSELLILAARPSMGKTALALNMVEHICFEGGAPVLFVSLEMSALEVVDRLLCSRAKIDSHRLRNGHLRTEESKKLVDTCSDISRTPLFIDDSPSRNMTEIAATARRLNRQENLALVVIDYLQLIDPDNSKDQRQEQVARIARRLKGLARELDIPVLCLAHLNRQVEATGSHKPQLSHLRESGAIEQDADVVMFIHREEYYTSDDKEREEVKGQADLMIKKHRNGRTGDIKLTWMSQYTRFENFQRPEYPEFNQDTDAF